MSSHLETETPLSCVAARILFISPRSFCVYELMYLFHLWPHFEPNFYHCLESVYPPFWSGRWTAVKCRPLKSRMDFSLQSCLFISLPLSVCFYPFCCSLQGHWAERGPQSIRRNSDDHVYNPVNWQKRQRSKVQQFRVSGPHHRAGPGGIRPPPLHPGRRQRRGGWITPCCLALSSVPNMRQIGVARKVPRFMKGLMMWPGFPSFYQLLKNKKWQSFEKIIS